MAAKQSAGILLYRVSDNHPQVFLVHPGGPFWSNKDDGAWSIPKGEFDDIEAPLEAARREFHEETGTMLSGNFISLFPVRQKSGKIIHAWALEGEIDTEKIVSNFFEMEWPPRSGKMKCFPEVDRAGWFGLETAKIKINPDQVPLIEQIQTLLIN